MLVYRGYYTKAGAFHSLKEKEICSSLDVEFMLMD